MRKHDYITFPNRVWERGLMVGVWERFPNFLFLNYVPKSLFPNSVWEQLLIVIIFIFIHISVYANSSIDNQTVTFTKFMDEMVNAKEKTTFENVKIRYVFAVDKFGMDKRFDFGGDELVVKQDIRLLNCDFDLDYWLVLRKMTFMEYFAVFNCTPLKCIFKDCTFKKTCRIYTDNIEFMDFDTCRFEHGFKFVRNSLKDRLKFTGCNFSINEKLFFDTDALDMEARIFLLSNKGDGMDITFDHCGFFVPEKLIHDPQYFITLTASNFSNIRFNDNTVHASIDFSQSTVSNMFMTYGCTYYGHIIMDAFNVNPLNTRVQWSSVSGSKISVLDPKTRTLYNGEHPDSLKDEFLFNSLVSCYSTFYNAFKSQGNRIAANACYVEWKDIETQYLKNVYKTSPDRKLFFSYIMDSFLKFFCDYGTNPLKAIGIAGYVLLGFAGIYFFFPYRIKTFQRRTLYEQLKLYGHYLSSPQSLLELEDSQMAKHKEPQSYQEYIKFLEGTEKKIPLVLSCVCEAALLSREAQG